MKKLFLFLFFLLSPAALEATTYHVHKSGSDANSCATAQASGASAKLTVVAGVACLASGDTLSIHAGTYTESSDISAIPAGGGSFASATIIEAATGETVELKRTAASGQLFSFASSARNYIIIRGQPSGTRNLILDGDNTGSFGLYIESAHHIRLQDVEVREFASQNIGFFRQSTDESLGGNNELINVYSHSCTVQGTLSHGAYLGSSNNLVDGGEYTANGGHGIQAYIDPAHGRGAPNNNTIRKVNFHDNPKTCLGMYHGTGNLAYNNLMKDCGESGGRASGTASKWLNNSFYSNSSNCIEILSGSSHQFINNICYANGSPQIVNNGSGTIQTTNLTASDPLFVNAPTDLQVTAGSLAIDGGTSQAATFTTDYAGVTRPAGLAWDIGAYEFTGSDTITVLVPNGGQSWDKDVQQTITWGSTGSIVNVKILADRDGNGSYEETVSASTTNDGSFNWTPGGSANANVKIRIEDASDASPFDVSDAVFAITTDSGGTVTKIISDNTTGDKTGDINGSSDAYIEEVSATNPHDTTLLYIGKFAASEHVHGLLKFEGLSQIPSNAVVNSVTLGLYLSGGGTAAAQTFDIRRVLRTWTEIATWNTYDGTNSWGTVGGLNATDRTSTALAQITGVTITPGYFTVTDSSEAVGDIFEWVQNVIDGTWTNQGLHIERNGAGEDGAWRAFVSSEGTNGQRPYLEVTYTTTVATLTVTQPTTGGHVFPGDAMPIRWQSSGVSGNVNIYISYNGGTFYETTPIVANYPFNQADASWTVTGPSGSNVKIKVVSANDTSVSSESPAFKIAGTRLGIR